MHYKTVSILCTLLVSIISGACSNPKRESKSATKQAEQEESIQLPNPASENCIKVGGKLLIEKKGRRWRIRGLLVRG